MLKKDTGLNHAVVLGVILYSDATILPQNLRGSAWPVYMTLANIPLHKRRLPGCFQLIGLLPDMNGT